MIRMTLKINIVKVVFMLFTLTNPASAGIAIGTFSGSVYDAWGSAKGFDLTVINGQTITGSFAFQPNALPSCCTDGSTYNAALVHSPTIPVHIYQTVSYQSSNIVFNFMGDSFSEVYVGKNHTSDPYGNWLYIQASQLDSNGAYIMLRNTDGMSYISNVQDLGSFDFFDFSPDSFGVNTFGDSSYAPAMGGFSFTIAFSSGIGFTTHSVIPAEIIPEPSTLALLALGVAGFAFSRRKFSITTCDAFSSS